MNTLDITLKKGYENPYGAVAYNQYRYGPDADAYFLGTSKVTTGLAGTMVMLTGLGTVSTVTAMVRMTPGGGPGTAKVTTTSGVATKTMVSIGVKKEKVNARKAKTVSIKVANNKVDLSVRTVAQSGTMAPSVRCLKILVLIRLRVQNLIPRMLRPLKIPMKSGLGMAKTSTEPTNGMIPMVHIFIKARKAKERAKAITLRVNRGKDKARKGKASLRVRKVSLKGKGKVQAVSLLHGLCLTGNHSVKGIGTVLMTTMRAVFLQRLLTMQTFVSSRGFRPPLTTSDDAFWNDASWAPQQLSLTTSDDAF